MDISKFGKGAVPTPKVIRDKQYRLAAQAPAIIDWSTPYKVPINIPVLNQGSSSSCTAHATAEYCMALNQLDNKISEEYSRRFIYSQSSLGPNQGAYIWKAMSIALKGLASAASVPDGMDENTEIDPSFNNKAVVEARADKYAVIPRSNIDQLAQVIQQYGGFVTGFNGWDGMFAADGTIANWSKVDWGHAVYVYGYEMRGGIKCLRFRNSWSSAWGSGGDGFMPEAFVNSGLMFDCYTYADVADLDPNSIMLTQKEVQQLQALEGYSDPSGVMYWGDGTHTLAQYLAARLADKVKTIQSVQ